MGARSGLEEPTLGTVMGAGSGLVEPSQMVTGLVRLMQRQQQGHLRRTMGAKRPGRTNTVYSDGGQSGLVDPSPTVRGARKPVRT